MRIKVIKYTNKYWREFFEMMVITMDYHMKIAKPKIFNGYSEKMLRNYCLSLTMKNRKNRGSILLALVKVNREYDVAGFIYFEKDKFDKEDTKFRQTSGTIYEIYVKKGYRNEGIGTVLMARCEKELHENGCRLIGFMMCML